MTSTRWRGAAACAVMSAGLALASAPAIAQGNDAQAALAARLDQLAAELAAVKADLARMQQQQAANATVANAPATIL